MRERKKPKERGQRQERERERERENKNKFFKNISFYNNVYKQYITVASV